MADPVPTRSSSKWLWPVLIAMLALLLLFWLLNPSGDRTGAVDDPIVIDDVSEPGAQTGAGTLGEGLPATTTDPAGPASSDTLGDASATLTAPVDDPVAAPPAEAGTTAE